MLRSRCGVKKVHLCKGIRDRGMRSRLEGQGMRKPEDEVEIQDKIKRKSECDATRGCTTRALPRDTQLLMISGQRTYEPASSCG